MRKNPTLFGSGFAITSKSKLYPTRKRKTGIGNIYGQHQLNGAAQSFLFSTELKDILIGKSEGDTNMTTQYSSPCE